MRKGIQNGTSLIFWYNVLVLDLAKLKPTMLVLDLAENKNKMNPNTFYSENLLFNDSDCVFPKTREIIRNFIFLEF